ncbi:unnamed protein product [Lepidochelys kempii]
MAPVEEVVSISDIVNFTFSPVSGEPDFHPSLPAGCVPHRVLAGAAGEWTGPVEYVCRVPEEQLEHPQCAGVQTRGGRPTLYDHVALPGDLLSPGGRVALWERLLQVDAGHLPPQSLCQHWLPDLHQRPPLPGHRVPTEDAGSDGLNFSAIVRTLNDIQQ